MYMQPSSALPQPKPKNAVLHFFQHYRESSVIIVLAIICVLLYFSSARSTFYSPGNMQNLLLQIALLSVFAIGETVVILTGGIDLSLGSLIAFSGMVLAMSATSMNEHMYTGA